MMDYDKILSERALSLKPSGIRKFFDLLGNAKDVISLTVGQPDFVTPWHIREAGIKSLEEGRTYYTSNSGLMELREAVSAYQKRRFGLEYSPDDEIIITIGGSEAIDIALRVIINPGDEVIIPEPCFVCYAPLVVMAGGVPVILPLKSENKFKVTADELKNAITARTKAFILAFPNNPTGAVMEKQDLEPLVKILKNTNIIIISDEIYAELTYDTEHVSIAGFESMRERTIIASGFSKAYAMTGWRLGYTLAPSDISQKMFILHQYEIMCAPTTSQYAAIEALNNGDEDIEYMKSEYNNRRRFVLDGLKDAGIDCFTPGGAFYVFPDISKFGLSSDEFCQRLLDEKRVAIVPGGAFGDTGNGFARISYAYSVKHLDKAIKRIKEFVETLG